MLILVKGNAFHVGNYRNQILCTFYCSSFFKLPQGFWVTYNSSTTFQQYCKTTTKLAFIKFQNYLLSRQNDEQNKEVKERVHSRG